MTPYPDHDSNDDLPFDSPLIDGLDELPAGAFDLVDEGFERSSCAQQRILIPFVADLRRRRRLRHARWFASLAAAFLVGLVTPAWLWRTPPVLAPTDSSTISQVPAPPEAAPDDAAERPDATAVADDLDPAELRRQVATAPPAEQRRLLRAAGDIYLSRYDDVRAAIYCYQQLLELETALGEADPRDDDSWLLANLRYSREPLFAGEPN